MTRLLITGGQIYTPFTHYSRGNVLIEDDKIVAVGPAAGFANALDVMRIDASGLLVVPGFIELQVNGGYSRDFAADPASIPLVAGRLPETGVTAFLPTIITSPLEHYREAFDVISRPPESGAQILGLHLEGPYLNPQRAGAHDRRWLRAPAEADLDAWQPLERVRIVTLAPELPGATALIERLQQAGVTVSAGHSNATYDQAIAAFNAGVCYVTHLFNAMSPFHHREPGLVGAALTDSRVRVGLIVDGVHLHPAAVKLAWEAAGPDGVTLVTDSIAAMGVPSGKYMLGDQHVIVKDGQVRLPNGTLAGSVVTMDQSLRNLIAYTGCTLADALRAVTTTPAAVIGADTKGRIVPGADADLVLLTPELQIAGALVAGHFAYQSPSMNASPSAL